MNIEKISEVKTGSYFLRVSDIIDLLNSTDNDAFMAMNLRTITGSHVASVQRKPAPRKRR